MRDGRLMFVGRRGPAFEEQGPAEGASAAIDDLGGLPADKDADVGVVDLPETVTPSEPRGRDRRRPGVALARWCRLQGLLVPVLDYVDAEAGWRFDAAWPSASLAVVFEGGPRDLERSALNEAGLAGWLVLRVTHAEVFDGVAGQLVLRELGRPRRSAWPAVGRSAVFVLVVWAVAVILTGGSAGGIAVALLAAALGLAVAGLAVRSAR